MVKSLANEGEPDGQSILASMRSNTAPKGLARKSGSGQGIDRAKPNDPTQTTFGTQWNASLPIGGHVEAGGKIIGPF